MQTAAESTEGVPDAHAQTRSSFFVVYAIVMLLLVVAGFSRTYYLRPLFSAEQLPIYLQVHGALLTGWFTLFLFQSILIRQRRASTHQLFGVIGCVIAVAVVIITLFTLVNVYPFLAASGHDIDLAGTARMAQIIRDLFLVSAFPVFFTLAVVFRHRSQAHKRLMLLASISLLPAAVGRIFRWPAFSDIPEAPATFAVMLSLIVAVAVHDIVIRKRVHPVVAWGGPIYFIWLIVGALLVEYGFT
jgi:hypothetical protein